MKFDIRYFPENMSRKFKFHCNLIRIMGTLREDPYIFFIMSRSLLLRMRNVADRSCRINQNTHFELHRALCGIMWKKYLTAGQATDDNMAHGHCMQDTYGYRRTLRICNTYFFCIVTMVARTRLDFMLYVH